MVASSMMCDGVQAMANLFPALGCAATRIVANAGIYQALTQLPPAKIVQVQADTSRETRYA